MKTILIADDNLASRELLTDALAGFEARLLEASDGREALSKIQIEAPDLVLLDIQMPSLDGFAVLQAMRGLSSPGSIKVIALTAFAMESDRQRISEAGFDGYISKPVSILDLRKKVEHWLYGDERADCAEA